MNLKIVRSDSLFFGRWFRERGGLASAFGKIKHILVPFKFPRSTFRGIREQSSPGEIVVDAARNILACLRNVLVI